MSLGLRFAALLLLWLAMGEAGPADLLAGVAAALFAAVLSLRLLPPGTARVHPVAGLRLLAHVAWQSVPAGIDVARRAFARDMRLRPGLAAVPTRLPPGRRRAAFNTLSSLLPGTVAVGPGGPGTILLHCLDLRQDAASQSAATEALFTRAAGGGRG